MDPVFTINPAGLADPHQANKPMILKTILGCSSALFLSAAMLEAQETNVTEKFEIRLKQMQESFDKQQREMKEHFEKMLQDQQQQIETLKKQVLIATNTSAVAVSS